MSTEQKANRVAAYLRVSTRGQTVESQRKAVIDWLHSQGLNIDPQAWYVDPYYTGAKADRPALDRLRAAVRRGEIDTVVVYALDRLARSTLDGLRIMQAWLDRGVRLVAVREQFDFRGHLGQFVASLLFALAQMERTVILERQAAGYAAVLARQREAKALHAAGVAPADIVRRLRIRATKKLTAVQVVEAMIGAPDDRGYWVAVGDRGGQNARADVTADRMIELLSKGFTMAEIARALGCAVRTLKSRAAAAGGMAVLRRAAERRRIEEARRIAASATPASIWLVETEDDLKNREDDQEPDSEPEEDGDTHHGAPYICETTAARQVAQSDTADGSLVPV